MVSIFHFSILLFVAIFIENSLQKKTKISINNNKDTSTSNLVKPSLISNENNDDISSNNNNNNNNNKKSFNLFKKPVRNGGRMLDGGHGVKCYTRLQLKMVAIIHLGRSFTVPQYVVIKYCNQF